MIIADLVPGVIKKLRGRDDVADDIPGYVKSALLDITQNYEFEELRVTGPITNFIQNLAEYPKSGNSCPFIYPGHLSITFVVSWYCWYSSTIQAPGSNTNNNLGLEMKGRTIRVVEPMSKISGQPMMYATIGNRIVVGYMPNIAYATQMRYQREHPFYPNNQLASSDVFIPLDWIEIIEYAAAEKACDNLGMNEIGTLYHQKLYGAPQSRRGPAQPGLITERMSQQSRNTAFNEKQLRPIVRLV